MEPFDGQFRANNVHASVQGKNLFGTKQKKMSKKMENQTNHIGHKFSMGKA